MEQIKIPDLLLADCHHLGQLPTSQILLNRNAHVPWVHSRSGHDVARRPGFV